MKTRKLCFRDVDAKFMSHYRNQHHHNHDNHNNTLHTSISSTLDTCCKSFRFFLFDKTMLRSLTKSYRPLKKDADLLLAWRCCRTTCLHLATIQSTQVGKWIPVLCRWKKATRKKPAFRLKRLRLLRSIVTTGEDEEGR